MITVGQFKIGLTHGHQIVPWGDVESLAMVGKLLLLIILLVGHVASLIAGVWLRLAGYVWPSVVVMLLNAYWVVRLTMVNMHVHLTTKP